MLKASLAIAVLICLVSDLAGAQVPAGGIAQKMEATCARTCHGPSLIAQQRLNTAGWTREVNKMIGWGADVADADKDALIAYLANTFNNGRPRPSSSKAMPEGKGMEAFQVSCLGCHDDKPVAALKTDRAGWTRVLDRMANWGAYLPAGRRDEIIEYLLKNFGKN
ncbi:MAG TPA: hypothetical protein VER98_18685 [Terriglobia bacterium]|nr:hypothetical protein [Terriglobia bacterium]